MPSEACAWTRLPRTPKAARAHRAPRGSMRGVRCIETSRAAARQPWRTGCASGVLMRGTPLTSLSAGRPAHALAERRACVRDGVELREVRAFALGLEERGFERVPGQGAQGRLVQLERF